MRLSERDRAIIWHPFTQEKTADWPLAITRAQGSYLYDDQGKAYLDLISSWWVNLHGHAHPDIARAIYEQAQTLEHVIFAGCTHEPAVQLCEQLQTLIPPSLSRYFFSDNGSTSVEAALKMAYQYWYNKGQKERTVFLSFEGGYHGDTFGAMSVGVRSGFHNPFQDLLFKVACFPFPATWQDDQQVEEKEEECLTQLAHYLDKNCHRIAAFIMEPLLQGASGMRLCRPLFQQRIIDLLKQYDILVIFDEIMTGFGRTGTYFAFEQIGRTPDILCLSKGLTGGFLPLALTVVKEEIYQAFLGDRFDTAFAHGHSYTANPLGCAAALASFKLLTSQETREKITMLGQSHQAWIASLKKNFPYIKALRTLGTIVAFNLEGDETNYHYNLVPTLKKKFLECGLLLRPLGNTLYLLPPYCLSQDELEGAYQHIEAVLQNIRKTTHETKTRM